jgi:hypothetical protein
MTAFRRASSRVRSSRKFLASSSYRKLASRTSCVARCSRCHCVVMPVAMIASTAASAVIEAMYSDVRIML